MIFKSHLKLIKILLSEPHYARVLFLRTLGNFLVLSAIFIVVKTVHSPAIEELNYLFNEVRGIKYVVSEETLPEEPKKGLLKNLLSQERIKPLVPVDVNFSVVVPKIAANANVIANVDAGNDSVYLPALQQGVAHASGTALPGEGGLIYMFAHSTDYFYNVSSYNAVFYLLYKLEPGDEIDIFYKGVRHKYFVYDRRIVKPDQVEFLTQKTSQEELRLQTCWPLGTTLERLIVFARPASEVTKI